MCEMPGAPQSLSSSLIDIASDTMTSERRISRVPWRITRCEPIRAPAICAKVHRQADLPPPCPASAKKISDAILLVKLSTLVPAVARRRL